MQAQLMAYFSGEKQEGLFFAAAGVAAIAVSIGLIKASSSYRGMAYPLVAVALIHLWVGAAVYFRTDARVQSLQQQMQDQPQQFQLKESRRMEGVMRNFSMLKTLEIVLLLTGIGMTFAFRHSDLLYSAGIGLFIQAAVTLVLDLFAERRAEHYLAALQSLT